MTGVIDIPNGPYLLVVDDDEEDVFAFKWALKSVSPEVQVVHTTDGAAALDFLLALTEEDDLPQIILVDINMPGVNGFETLAAIRNSKITQHLPVIMFSTSDSPTEIRNAYLAGANAHLVKRNSIKELKVMASALATFWLQQAALPGR